MKPASLFVVALLGLLTACSGANGTAAVAPPRPSTNEATSTATFRITIPTPPPSVSSSTRKPQYVSYRVESLQISGTGLDAPNNSVTANVTPTSPGCSGTPSVCAVQIPTNIGLSESFSITAYASTGGTGSVLSTGKVTTSIASGLTNTITVALNPVQTLATGGTFATSIATAPNGTLFVNTGSAIANYDPATGTFTACNSSVTIGSPDRLVIGPDGNLWVPVSSTGIEKIALSGSACGASATYTASIGVPSSLISGSDGNLWFVESSGNVDKMTPSGTLTTAIATIAHFGTWALGPSGNLWIATTTGAISTLTTSGTLTALATLPAPPVQLVLGSDGNMWAFAGTTVSKITPTGTVTNYTLTLPETYPAAALGPDGNIWYFSFSALGWGVENVTPAGTSTILSNFSQSVTYGGGNIAFGSDGNLYFDGGPNLYEFVR
uniref:Virginiamycin B lyase n=1 Tax=mine drainage metagenome TaxID=410659 RepID=E6Q2R6_9ZZZZ